MTIHRIASQISPLPHVGERAWVRGNSNPGNCYVPPLTPLRRSATLEKLALPEIVWAPFSFLPFVRGATTAQSPPLCKGRSGGVECSTSPRPLLTKEGTPLGTTDVLPRTHMTS